MGRKFADRALQIDFFQLVRAPVSVQGEVVAHGVLGHARQRAINSWAKP